MSIQIQYPLEYFIQFLVIDFAPAQLKTTAANTYSTALALSIRAQVSDTRYEY